MAVNETRSMNEDLLAGITDGIVKKSSPNRGGDMYDEHCIDAVNMILHQDLYDAVTDNPFQDIAASRVAYRR